MHLCLLRPLQPLLGLRHWHIHVRRCSSVKYGRIRPRRVLQAERLVTLMRDSHEVLWRPWKLGNLIEHSWQPHSHTDL